MYLQDAAMFQCRGDGSPEPNVTWYKDDTLLPEKSNVKIYKSGVLEIYPVKFTDFGSYYCIVKNTEKSRQSRTAILTQNADIGEN